LFFYLFVLNSQATRNSTKGWEAGGKKADGCWAQAHSWAGRSHI